jgi:tetratricopeptide (TPR) repeat protein
MQALGAACLASGQHEKALAMFQKTVDAHCVLHGGLDHPSLAAVVASSSECLKRLYGETGNDVVQYLRMVVKELQATEMADTIYTRAVGYATHGDERDVAAEALWQLATISMARDEEKGAKGYAKKALDLVSRHHRHPLFHYFDFGESRYQHNQLGKAHMHLAAVYVCVSASLCLFPSLSVSICLSLSLSVSRILPH